MHKIKDTQDNAGFMTRLEDELTEFDNILNATDLVEGTLSVVQKFRADEKAEMKLRHSPPSLSPDALALEAELQVLSELLPSDVGTDCTKVVEVSESDKLSLPLANSMVRLMLTPPVTVASNKH